MGKVRSDNKRKWQMDLEHHFDDLTDKDAGALLTHQLESIIAALNEYIPRNQDAIETIENTVYVDGIHKITRYPNPGTFTWIKDPRCKSITVMMWAGGGGGGGGIPNDVDITGGSGGGGGAMRVLHIDAFDLESSETFTVGSGGTGGAESQDGSAGGLTSFAGFNVYGGGAGCCFTAGDAVGWGGAGGGVGGVGDNGRYTGTGPPVGGRPTHSVDAGRVFFPGGGGANGQAGSTYGLSAEYGGGGGGGGNTSNAAPGGGSLYGGGGGGCGGRETDVNGASGGASGQMVSGSGGSGGTTAGQGTNGSDGANGTKGSGGAGGGGGGSSSSNNNNGGNGGHGGSPGGGGGGGGGCKATGTGIAGTGGNGGDGKIIIIEHL